MKVIYMQKKAVSSVDVNSGQNGQLRSIAQKSVLVPVKKRVGPINNKMGV